MLEIDGLRAGYGDVSVLRGIDLTVGSGEIVALVGANGAGKSTLAKAISGLLSARQGRIMLDGSDIARLTPRQRVRLGIAHVPEGRQIIAGLTVGENLRLGAYARRRELGEAGLARRISEVCRSFPILLERLDEIAGNLSGGQQQMLSIARALMSAPRLIILDEPSLGLSPTLVAEIFRLIDGLRARRIAILLAEQNARLSLAIADRAYVIEMGSVAMEGRGADLLGRPEIVERYLGIGAAADGGGGEREAARHAALVQGLRRILGAEGASGDNVLRRDER
jgi:branched-chain amino acid transport system ATP-binding protein